MRKRHVPRNDGIILPDSPFGKSVGFTSDKFDAVGVGGVASYLWKKDNEIVLSLITSLHEGQGNLSALIRNIEAKGYTVAVPNPIGKMVRILFHLGFSPTEEDSGMGMVDVWRKEKA